jgi:glycosyltransferase involved in cell wall biosynthesis
MLPDPLDAKARLPWESDYQITPAHRDHPGMSIVLPIFNAGKYLEKTIRSLLCNDLTGIEIIVMDGGSTDDTAAILEHYREFFHFCISEPDGGQSDAINRGFTKADQPIFYWLNGDDLLLPNVLTPIRARFAASDRPDVVVGDAYMTELDLKPIRHFQFSREKLAFDHLIDYAANHLIQPSVFFSRKAWETCGPVAENLHYAMDADLFLTMASRFEFVHLPLDIAYSVYHEDCKTRGKRAESITELAMVQARHGGFDHARKTLDILVELFNEKERSSLIRDSANTDQTVPCPQCKTYKMKLEALETRLKDKMKVLLDADLLKS